jgi:hypothetical protein
MRTLLLFLSLIILTGCKDTPSVNTPPETLKEALNASEFTTALAPLIDPSKLDTLKGKRAATPRLRKACYWLQMAHTSGFDAGEISTKHTPKQAHTSLREPKPNVSPLSGIG